MSLAMDEDSPAASVSGNGLEGVKRKRKSLPLHRCRFPDFSPSAISALSITPLSFDTASLAFGGASHERGVLAVGRANGDVELMCWGGQQGWIAWRVRNRPLVPYCIYSDSFCDPTRRSRAD